MTLQSPFIKHQKYSHCKIKDKLRLSQNVEFQDKNGEIHQMKKYLLSSARYTYSWLTFKQKFLSCGHLKIYF